MGADVTWAERSIRHIHDDCGAPEARLTLSVKIEERVPMRHGLGAWRSNGWMTLAARSSMVSSRSWLYPAANIPTVNRARDRKIGCREGGRGAEFQRWVWASCSALAKAWCSHFGRPYSMPMDRGGVPLKMITMVRLIPLWVGSAGRMFLGTMRCASSFCLGFKVVISGGSWVGIRPPESAMQPSGQPRFAG